MFWLKGPSRSAAGTLSTAHPSGTGATHAWAPRGPGTLRGSPKVARGRVPKVPYCCATESFWRSFWYPFWGRTCTQFYKELQNGGPKSCQNRPSWAGAWGAWVLAVFIEGAWGPTSYKKNNHPSSPSTRPGGLVLTTFWTPILDLFVELCASSAQKGVPK